MEKNSLPKKEFKPIDYFRGVQNIKEKEKTTTENLVQTLRSDMVPASDTLPAQENLLQKIDLKLWVGVVIGLVIIGLIMYSVVGAGRQSLEKKLSSLIRIESTATQEAIPTPFSVINQATETSETPRRNPTTRPTNTQAIVIAASPTIKPPSITPTKSPGKTSTPVPLCREANTITLEDVGQTLCTSGVVIEIINLPNSFMVIFSTEKGAFYWVSYDMVWTQAEVDTCYQITGMIRQIANSPILVFDYSNIPEVCP